ncbi:hypothetical protein DIPPA_22750 [Diplonema papillatum]|nr:hypothetical protein DIPPA_22750 [Diplonema papillatum]
MRPSNDEHPETLAAAEALKKALNAKVEALNAKEEALKDALVACVTKIGGDTGTAQFGIYNGSDTTANALKDALKELKDEKKSLNAQLEEVQKRLTLLAQAPPQAQYVQLEQRLQHGARALSLRQKILSILENNLAFNESIVADRDDYVIKAVFQSETAADLASRQIATCAWTISNNLLSVFCETESISPPASLRKTLAANYDPRDAPDRKPFDEVYNNPSSPTSSASSLHSKLDTCEIENESPIRSGWFERMGKTADVNWARLKPKKSCAPSEQVDKANRLILPSGLHAAMDADPPEVTFSYLGEEIVDGKLHLILKARFTKPSALDYWVSAFNSAITIDSTSCQCKIFLHPNPERFKRFLEYRVSYNERRQAALYARETAEASDMDIEDTQTTHATDSD